MSYAPPLLSIPFKAPINATPVLHQALPAETTAARCFFTGAIKIWANKPEYWTK